MSGTHCLFPGLSWSSVSGSVPKFRIRVRGVKDVIYSGLGRVREKGGLVRGVMGLLSQGRSG